ncbi:MAG TPA: DISARM system phospholipase D-like protein DrmC [Archangium sp.]|nr:DISARM system phospholipase D-like protein DrmC [Archangium sp.]
MEALAALSDDALDRLASALRRGTLRAPFGPRQLAAYLPEALCAGAASALTALVASGASEQAAALTLRAMVQARAAVPSVADRVRLVTSGPAPQAEGRDTAVVVRELFAQAEQEVLVVGFTAFRAAEIFAPLVQRSRERDLHLCLCLNVGRSGLGDARAPQQLLSDFRRELTTSIWPEEPVPPIHYDPRALLPHTADTGRGCLHAKCVVVDGHLSFITSANFTEAAQDRNIEVGALIRDEDFARALRGHFEGLIAAGRLLPL